MMCAAQRSMPTPLLSWRCWWPGADTRVHATCPLWHIRPHNGKAGKGTRTPLQCSPKEEERLWVECLRLDCVDGELQHLHSRHSRALGVKHVIEASSNRLTTAVGARCSADSSSGGILLPWAQQGARRIPGLQAQHLRCNMPQQLHLGGAGILQRYQDRAIRKLKKSRKNKQTKRRKYAPWNLTSA